MAGTTIAEASDPRHEPATAAGNGDGHAHHDIARPSPDVGGELPAQRLERLEREVGKRDGYLFTVLGIAIVVMFASFIAIGWVQHLNKGGGAATAAGQTITADLTEYTITLSSSAVTPGSTITVTNGGTAAHTLGVMSSDLLTPSIPPGGTATLDLSSLEPGDYTLYCDIAGHLQAGMKAPLTVSETATTAAAGSAATMGMTAAEHAAMTTTDGAAMDQAMLDSIAAFPAATEGEGNQPLTATILPDGTKHFDLTASIIDWEVSPGNTVKAWAYNGMVPGPRIDLQVGDKVEVTLTNQLPMGTDIHMHGIDLPNDQDGVAPITQHLVTAGQTYTYRFTATEAAIGMYHAHAHGDTQIPNGLFGTMYVGDIPAPAGRTISGIPIPADLTIAQDVPMVLNDAGVIGLTLNAKSFPATAPLVVNNGDWVRVTYFNEGMQAHPMHLHGFEQIVYAKDGEPLDAPYAADTILVGPGERYTVLFHADQVGTWVWHCHILNHVEAETGMFGMVTAVVVQ
jgi:FtsP/CotA-like multicopper oxidase with cupredoxin domain